jgi:hypothetical protein
MQSNKSKTSKHKLNKTTTTTAPPPPLIQVWVHHSEPRWSAGFFAAFSTSPKKRSTSRNIPADILSSDVMSPTKYMV